MTQKTESSKRWVVRYRSLYFCWFDEMKIVFIDDTNLGYKSKVKVFKTIGDAENVAKIIDGQVQEVTECWERL